MDLLVRPLDQAVVVSPQGRIDQASAEQFRLALQPHLTSCCDNCTGLIIDFSSVTYISSIGLRVLMLAARQVETQKGKLALAALQPLVREVFQISRFDMVFKIFDSVEAAGATLRSQ